MKNCTPYKRQRDVLSSEAKIEALCTPIGIIPQQSETLACVDANLNACSPTGVQ